MIVKNKKNGTNVLAYKSGAQIIKVILRGGEQANITSLESLQQVINKADFNSRGWFEIIKEEEKKEDNESVLERVKKEVKEYTSENNTEDKI